MRNLILYILPYFLALVFTNGNIEAQSLVFNHIGEKDGFPSSSVLCLLQDKQGFVWVGTTDGLFRYDGKEFREFRADNNDSSSISNNYIKCLYEDQYGDIWIGTARGLNRYSTKYERFDRFLKMGGGNKFEGENNIHSLIEDKEGFIWYGTYGGLFRLDAKSRDWLQFLPQVENPNSITDAIVWSVFEDKDGNLWFATANGVTVYKNDGTFQFDRYLPEPENPNGLKTGRIWGITQQPNGTIWMGSNDGFYRVIESADGYKYQRFGNEAGNPNSLSHNFVENIIAESNERLWICTFNGGLNEVRLTGDDQNPLNFIHHKNDDADKTSLRMNQVTSILKDRSENIWVGTSGGLDKVTPSKNKFHAVYSSNLDLFSLSDPIIKAIHRDSHGNLWVGTRNGLNFLSAEKFKNKEYKFNSYYHNEKEKNSLSHSNIFGIFEDSQGYIWVSTFNGLNYINLNDFEINITDNKLPSFDYFTNDDGLPHSYIRNVKEIRTGEYWVLTYGQLSKMTFDPSNIAATQFQNYDMDDSKNDALVNASTMVAEKDQFGQYWIGTFNGVSKYMQNAGREFFDNYKNELNSPESLSNNTVSDMLLDSKGRLWIATRGGLNLVIQKNAGERAKFRSFGYYDGIPNDVIQSIEEDKMGDLWLGTNRGLVHFDPDKIIKNESPVIKTYYKNDGLASNAMVFRASHCDVDGNLFFGTPGGLNYFKPSDLSKNQNLPEIVITELKILNKQAKISEKNKTGLKASICKTDTIYLEYWQNMISLKFAGLEFTNPSMNKYAYKMTGVDEEWVYSGHDNNTTYTNLSPGKYLFEVKGSNNDGNWNENPTALTIEIFPPPWKTWWAYIIYILSFSSLIYFLIKLKINKKIRVIKTKAAIEKARFEERELLRKQNAADFHDELGHRLTKIALFIELAERQLLEPTTVKQLLNKISENTIGLSNGMRDLIWTLDPKSDSLFQTLLRLQEFGDKLFDRSGILFNSIGIHDKYEKLPLPPDVRKQVLLIFKEGMHNCLKYSSATSCQFIIEEKETHFDIFLKDDGNGFDEEIKIRGYGIKNMKERAKKINAIFTIMPIIGTGTTILLKINIAQMG